MTTYEPRAAEYLAHIVDAAEWIATVSVGLDEPGFVTNRVVRDVVVRNRLTHGYETLDFAIIWRVVCRDLPALVGQIRLICPADRL